MKGRTMAEQIRTFIAIELEPPQRAALGAVQETLKRERAGRYVRWVAPESIHLTLKFLGGVDASRMTELQAALTEACRGIPTFTLRISGIGAFPNARRPRVVWVGLQGDTAIAAQLAERIEAAFDKLGFPKEERPFSPHLTIGRIKRDVSSSDQQFVGEMVTQAQVGELGEIKARQVSIMKSDLRPTGSIYTQLYAVQLIQNQ
jgi:2'-5' RNA ligase